MTYKEELSEFVETMRQVQKIPDYFLNVYQDTQTPKAENRKKNVAIIGDPFCSLYVSCSGLTPIFLGGGSYNTGEGVSHFFPQISDPVAKSSLGLLVDEELGLYKNIGTLILTATNDSYKKSISFLKEMGIKVIQVEPPSYVTEKMPLSYVKEQLLLLNEISKITNSRLSETRLKKDIKAYKEANQLMQGEKWKSLPTLTQDFFVETLYLAPKKEEWISQVQTYLQSVTVRETIRPMVLMGSALKFPCTKMYNIFEDIGIGRFRNLCIERCAYHKIKLSGSGLMLMKGCMKFQYQHEFCAQTLTNPSQYRFSKDMQGIIYHLLKGQVSSAYEAEQIEKAAIEQGIPFLCVETDYTYADKEQVKIRIEAFCEMLRSKAATA